MHVLELQSKLLLIDVGNGLAEVKAVISSGLELLDGDCFGSFSSWSVSVSEIFAALNFWCFLFLIDSMIHLKAKRRDSMD